VRSVLKKYGYYPHYFERSGRMNEEYIMQKEYSETISALRYSGDIKSAIAKCIEAIEHFPDNNFFYKILGDLYVQIDNFEKASKAYLEQLKRLHTRPDQFKIFARFYRYLENKTSEDFVREFRSTIAASIRSGDIAPGIAKQLSLFFGKEFITDPEILELFKKTDNDINLREVRKFIENKISTQDINIVRTIIDYRIASIDRHKSRQTDEYFISVSERLEMFDRALVLVKNINGFLHNPTGVRTLLRICRKLNDYSVAENSLVLNEKYIEDSDFNVQYELVYYYEFNKNDILLNRTLRKMRSSASSSAPIARTLYNFYLRFNMFDEAKEASLHMKQLASASNRSIQHHGRFEEQQIETEQGIWTKLQDLVSDQEHNRQMIAIRDLLKGFSHELGQPITNIRYSIQLHQMKIKKGVASTENIENLLKLILSQTERIGSMLARFRPIISSRSKAEYFNVFGRISAVFTDLNTRLETCGIKYSIIGDKFIHLWGDAIQFDQVFYNLILNSMQAIISHKNCGTITVIISKTKQEQVKISFSDDGPGIPNGITKQIFEPFFSTKEPSSEDGGEGLGLFIVWNILKMFNGSIRLNKEYAEGAKFDMIIPIKEGATKNE